MFSDVLGSLSRALCTTFTPWPSFNCLSTSLKESLNFFFVENQVAKSEPCANPYFIGRFFGKHSLIPRISPHKTIEGTIGGLIFSVITALAGKLYLPNFSLPHHLTLGFLLGILAQVGDLAESLLKRDCAVKDAGSSISGFGGMLDIIDSLIFTAPIFYCYVKVLLRC